MQHLNIKSDDETWSPATPYVRAPQSAVVNGQTGTDPSGRWVRAKTLWRKTGTGWVSVESVDTVPGANPVVASSINASTGMLDITAVNKDTRALGIYILVSTSAYPTNYTETSGLALRSFNPSVVAGGQYKQSVKVTAGLTYYVSVWAVPLNQLVSTRITTPAIKATKTTPTPPKLYTNTMTITTTDSRTYQRVGAGNWYVGSFTNYVWQSGPKGDNGYWYYGTALTDVLRYCTKIISAQITIQRYKGAIGPTGAANVHLGYHAYTSKISGRPIMAGFHPVIGTLNRGQTKNFTIPSDWYSSMINGQIKGFGLYLEPTTEASKDYMTAYGKGTVSGQLKITAQFTRAPRITMTGGSQVITYSEPL